MGIEGFITGASVNASAEQNYAPAARYQIQMNDDGVYGLINTSYNQSGLQTGAGVTTAVTRHLFLRLDALYTFFPSQTHQGTTNQSYNNQFSQLAAEFSLSYKFGG